jgi:hypothetical protein
MITAQLNDFLARLRKGTPEPADRSFLESVRADDLIQSLQPMFRLTFQERRIGQKREMSIARSLRTELRARPIRDSVFFSMALVPVYSNCVTINSENGAVTSISWINRLSVRAVRKPTPGLALTTGHGFKLQRVSDSWETRQLKHKTVRLSESFLRARGWRFDHTAQMVPTR